MYVRLLILTVALGCVLSTGCRSRCRRDPVIVAPAPAAGAVTIPPAGIPEGTPPPPTTIPRGSAPAPAPPPSGELLLPQNQPDRNQSQYPRVMPPKQRAILGNPDYVEKPKVVESDSPPAKADPGARPEPPPATSKRPDTSADPVGLPDFTPVKDGVAAGRRPELDGLDWLKAKGYKTVLNVRRPDEDDTSDRRQVERREMKYQSLSVTPDTLTQDWVDEFNRVVGETGSRPIYVYGDPALVGAVWYLHLRTAEFLTHDEARVRAGRLGKVDPASDWFKAAQKLAPAN